MQEVELKFQLPVAQQTAVQQLFIQRGISPQYLLAYYYDTTDQRLAKHRIGLRVRREGQQWIQTFKASGNQPWQRLEINTVLGQSQTVPSPELKSYQTIKQVKILLDQASIDLDTDLNPQFSTNIKRYTQLFRHQHSIIEVSLDSGTINTAIAQLKIGEIEFELKRGRVKDLFTFARTWIIPYALWFDVRNKAELGNLLVQGYFSKPNLFHLPEITETSSVLAQIQCTLLQLLSNLAAISAQLTQRAHIEQTLIALQHLINILQTCMPNIISEQTSAIQLLKNLYTNLSQIQLDDASLPLTPALLSALAQYTTSTDLNVLWLDLLQQTLDSSEAIILH